MKTTKFNVKMVVSVCFMAILIFVVYMATKTDSKQLPYTFIADFEGRYLQSNNRNPTYELIDQVAFSLSNDNTYETYSAKNYDSGVVFSFTDTSDSIDFTITINGDDQTFSGGFGGYISDSAVLVDLVPEDDYEFKYGLGVINNNSNPLEFNNSLVESSTGIMKIYKVIN